MQKLKILFCILMSFAFVVHLSGFFGVAEQPKTISNLLAQVSGEKTYWNHNGQPHSTWDSLNVRHYEQRVKKYALRELAEMGSDASQATDQLLELLEEEHDYNTGDGILSMRYNIVHVLAKIDDAKTIKQILNLYRKKALDSQTDNAVGPRGVRWHDGEYNGGLCGPDGMVTGLMWFDFRHHKFIKSELVKLLAELEADPNSSEWAKRSISREGLDFFQSSESNKREHVEIMLKSHYKNLLYH